ncbi:MAG: uncharacterized protein KVP18_003580 [Porospora cf. gigantea A]|uniref:uncharacterized protein n=2 Tax=Porospora cf. gigantea A TaxID=2853593 RepID=UPI0035597EA2|nr:MAG: hypothetical protein KVP18_003580 [Porospora cf. gigantea A]
MSQGGPPPTYKVIQKFHSAWRERNEQRLRIQVLEFSAWLVENMIEDCVEHSLVRAREANETRAPQAGGVAFLDPSALELYFHRNYLGLPQTTAQAAVAEAANLTG